MLIMRWVNFIDVACIWYRHSQSVAVRCTGRPLTESDNTRCCINTIHPPDDEHIMLETCRAVPLQAWSGREGSRKLKCPDFMTTAQEVGKVVSPTYRPHLPPENSAGTHFCLRLSGPQGHRKHVEDYNKRIVK